jgi:hypothetical protein
MMVRHITIFYFVLSGGDIRRDTNPVTIFARTVPETRWRFDLGGEGQLGAVQLFSGQ